MLEGRKRVIEKLARKGYRLTAQREAVLEALRATDSHPDPHWLYLQVREKVPHVSLGTIYRALHVLQDAGLVRKLISSGAVSRWDGDTQEHDHVLCISCGRLMDISLDAVKGMDERVARRTGYKIMRHRLEFYGLCPQCLAHEEAVRDGDNAH